MKQRAARSTLKTSTWLLEVLKDSAFGLAIYDRRLRLVAVNSAVAAMDRLPAEDHVGRQTAEIAGAASTIVEPLVEGVFRTGKPLNRFELSVKLPTREDVGYWIEDFVPITDDRSRVTEVGVIAMEITEQKRAEAIVRHLRRALRAGVQIRDGRILSALIKTAVHYDSAAVRGLPPRIILSSSNGESPFDTLSPRELQILRLLGQGESNKEAASRLKISEKTVETHRSRILLKLGLTSVVDLTHYAIRHGLVEP